MNAELVARDSAEFALSGRLPAATFENQLSSSEAWLAYYILFDTVHEPCL